MTDQKAIAGNDCVVSIMIDEVFYPIGCGVSCSFETENEIIATTTVGSGLWREKRVRRSDWRGTVSNVMISDNSADRYGVFYFLQEAIRRSVNTYEFSFTDLEGTEKTIVGDAIISLITINADQTSFAKWDLNIEGTGAIEFDVVTPAPPEGSCEIEDPLYLTLSEGATSVTDALLGTAGVVILEVRREGLQFNETGGTPGNREFRFVSPNISFRDAGNPGGEGVFVLYKIE